MKITNADRCLSVQFICRGCELVNKVVLLVPTAVSPQKVPLNELKINAVTGITTAPGRPKNLP